MLTPRNFVRNPYQIEAVQLTDNNLVEVAEWCDAVETIDGGAIVMLTDCRGENDRFKWAYVGDWIVKVSEGFVVYRNAEFIRHFDEINCDKNHTGYKLIHEDAMVKDSVFDV